MFFPSSSMIMKRFLAGYFDDEHTAKGLP